MAMNNERLAWRAIGMASGLAAGAVVRKALTAGWQRTQGTDPPANPASPRTTWAEALGWAAASGVTLAVARLVAQRGAAEAWRASTGSYPPGLEDVRP
jgi:hypothetical protein